MSHRYHSISISAFFCVLIASSLLCAPGGNRLEQSRTSLEDFSREPVRPVYTLVYCLFVQICIVRTVQPSLKRNSFLLRLRFRCDFIVHMLSYTLYLIVSTNFAISRFTDFIGSFVVSDILHYNGSYNSVSYLCFCR